MIAVAQVAEVMTNNLLSRTSMVAAVLKTLPHWTLPLMPKQSLHRERCASAPTTVRGVSLEAQHLVAT